MDTNETANVTMVRYSHDQKSISDSSLRFSRRNLVLFTLVWCCNNKFNFSATDDEILNKLRRSINFIIVIDNIDECIQFIEKVKDEKIILVVSNTTSEQILSKTHDSQQIISIYIFGKFDGIKNWKENYHKVSSAL